MFGNEVEQASDTGQEKEIRRREEELNTRSSKKANEQSKLAVLNRARMQDKMAHSPVDNEEELQLMCQEVLLISNRI